MDGCVHVTPFALELFKSHIANVYIKDVELMILLLDINLIISHILIKVASQWNIASQNFAVYFEWLVVPVWSDVWCVPVMSRVLLVFFLLPPNVLTWIIKYRHDDHILLEAIKAEQ
ncbi:hypothetical protein P8452_48014 [Trifolium repens]|nr:hypothetical protein P8452_48014 [Trifolium repens]